MSTIFQHTNAMRSYLLQKVYELGVSETREKKIGFFVIWVWVMRNGTLFLLGWLMSLMNNLYLSNGKGK